MEDRSGNNLGMIAKRALDLVGAVFGLALLWPLALVLAVAVWATMGSPAVFSQRRPGYRGKPFTMYKFRTMADDRGRFGELQPDARRITRLGRLLRRTSLDEILELVNVLKGEMSLVGPRPLLMEYLERYTPTQARRHDVKPGLTGWAQTNGRNSLTWEEKFELDIWYVDHRTFGLDIKVLCLTAVKVLRGEGVSARGHTSMPEFKGSSVDRSTEMRKESRTPKLTRS